MGFRIIVSVVCIVLLSGYGLPDVLSDFGINIGFSLNKILPGIVGLLLVMLSALWLAVDGFGEKHLLKTISLVVAGILALYFAANVINMFGWISIPIPGFIEIIKSWLYVISAVLLLIGIFAYH